MGCAEVKKFVIFKAAIFFILLTMMGCSDRAAVTSENDHKSNDRSLAVEDCGPVSPTYFYTFEAAKKHPYPRNRFFDTSEFYSQKFAWDPINPTIGFGGGPKSNDRSYAAPIDRWRSGIVAYEIIEKFELSEIKCWVAKGDQIATYVMRGSGNPVNISYWGELDLRQRNPAKDEYDLPHLTGYSDVGFDLKKVAEYIERTQKAAEFRSDSCFENDKGLEGNFQNCASNSMLSVFPLGVPGAHDVLFKLYYSGPTELRDPEKAYYHRLVASISGASTDAYKIKPYSCEHAEIYNNSPEMSAQLIRILEVDRNLTQEFKEKKLEELKKCLSLI